MKRIICVLISIILVSVIAVGCTQKLTPPEPVKSSEKSSQKTSEPSVPEVDESWKEPMKEAVISAMREYWEWVESDPELMPDGGLTKEDYYADSFFEIVYIDDDDIPEIFVSPYGSGVMGTGSCVIYVENGQAEKYGISWCDSIEYIPRSDRIVHKHGMHMPYQETVMIWSTQMALGSGVYDQPGWVDGEDHSFNGESLEYRWDDVPVSEADYLAKRKEVFGENGIMLGSGEKYGFAEILTYLNQTKTENEEKAELGSEEAISYLNIVLNDPDKLNDKNMISRMKYGLLYINDDDLPELAVYRMHSDQFACEDVFIYTCKDGKGVAVPIETNYEAIRWAQKYYEKKDYIYLEHCHEGIDDSSAGFEYSPVFDHSKPNYEKWDLNYPLWYDTGKEEDYNKTVKDLRCTRDGADISEAEYEAGVNALSLGEGKTIVDECLDFDEIVEILTGYIAPEQREEVKSLKNSPQAVPQNVQVPEEPGVPILYFVTVSAPDGYVNFRKGPGTDYEIIQAIDNGENMSVVEDNGKWLKVVYNRQEGYVAASQVKKL